MGNRWLSRAAPANPVMAPHDKHRARHPMPFALLHPHLLQALRCLRPRMRLVSLQVGLLLLSYGLA